MELLPSETTIESTILNLDFLNLEPIEEEENLREGDLLEEKFDKSARKKAMNTLKNKKDISSYLSKTKACHNVIKKENGEYTVCNRLVCHFAHSMEEKMDPVCVFDLNCRYKNSKCMFKHSDESRELWALRANQPIVDLPEKSKIPQAPVKLPPKSIKTLFCDDTKKKLDFSKEQIIKVPNEEAWKNVIREEFKKQNYNIRVIIE